MTVTTDRPLACVATALCDLRVLVIEDEWVVAQSYVALLENLGVTASGPAGTLAEAMRLIEAEPVDAALVDMNLHGEMAYGVVDVLNALGIAVVVVTGYDVVPELEHKVRPRSAVATEADKDWSGATVMTNTAVNPQFAQHRSAIPKLYNTFDC